MIMTSNDSDYCRFKLIIIFLGVEKQSATLRSWKQSLESLVPRRCLQMF